MMLNEEQLNKINEGLEAMIDFCPWFADQDLIYTPEQIREIINEGEDIETIDFDFPGEHDYTYVESDDFLDMCEELQSIEIVNSGLIKTKLTRYYIVGASDSQEDFILKTYHELYTKNKYGIHINLVDESIIVGMAATKLGEYESDYWGTVTPYLAIGIKYDDNSDILSEKEELDLVNSYIFEVADSTGITLTFSEIRNPLGDFQEWNEEMAENVPETLRELEPYNEAMKFFVSAVQIKDPELKFLNFYKVLEHFAPIAVNSEANELMRKKLDAPKSNFEDGDYIRSIFQLANSMKDRFNDEDLIKASFNTCFDFVGLFPKLPESLKKRIKKNIQEKDLNYSVDKQKLTTACNMAGKVIYKTRNRVVHAKSNFILSGDEIQSSEMQELNKFMKEASSQAIRWYERQPNHMRLEIIK